MDNKENEIILNYTKKLKDFAKSYSSEDLKEHVRYELIPILKIAKVMTEEFCNNNGTYFYIHSFITDSGSLMEYGVICWNGVEYNLLPFNTTANSRYATIRELSKYITGGHYDELDAYNDLVKKVGKEIIADIKISTLDL